MCNSVTLLLHSLEWELDSIASLNLHYSSSAGLLLDGSWVYHLKIRAANSLIVVSGKFNLGGYSKEPVVSMGVYVRDWTANWTTGWYIIIAPHCCRPAVQNVLFPWIEPLRLSPWDPWPPYLCFSFFLIARLALSQRAAMLALIKLQLQRPQQLAPRMWVRKSGTLQDSLVSDERRNKANR